MNADPKVFSPFQYAGKTQKKFIRTWRQLAINPYLERMGEKHVFFAAAGPLCIPFRRPSSPDRPSVSQTRRTTATSTSAAEHARRKRSRRDDSALAELGAAIHKLDALERRSSGPHTPFAVFGDSVAAELEGSRGGRSFRTMEAIQVLLTRPHLEQAQKDSAAAGPSPAPHATDTFGDAFAVPSHYFTVRTADGFEYSEL